MTSELKTCPFCGGRAKGREPEVNIDYVSCSECLACTPNENIWNTRTVPDMPELVRYKPEYEYDFRSIITTSMQPNIEGDYVRYDQVAGMLAAKDATMNGLLNALKNHTGDSHRLMAIRKLVERAVAAEADNKRLREALEFYKNGFSYHPKRTKTGIDMSAWKPTEKLLDDCGETARATLEEVKP